MWANTRNPNRIFIITGFLAPMNTYGGDSWEEKAFAEDAAGRTIGGCVWPPRSYSCSFCRREFRSAQALGGHMNVHRRDRARLKQSPVLPSSTSSEVVVPQKNHALNVCTSQIVCSSSFLCRNPKKSEFSDTRVSSPPVVTEVVMNGGERTMTALCFLPLNRDPVFLRKNDDFVVSSNPPSSSSFVSGLSKKEDCRRLTTDDSPMSLNLVICRKQTNNNTSGDDDRDASTCKRRRKRSEEEKPSSFFPEVTTVGSDKEQLDLELRLGNAPKAK
ncbi:hypothetical protein OROGR_017523 [Orobanche gracilis]